MAGGGTVSESRISGFYIMLDEDANLHLTPVESGAAISDNYFWGFETTAVLSTPLDARRNVIVHDALDAPTPDTFPEEWVGL